MGTIYFAHVIKIVTRQEYDPESEP